MLDERSIKLEGERQSILGYGLSLRCEPYLHDAAFARRAWRYFPFYDIPAVCCCRQDAVENLVQRGKMYFPRQLFDVLGTPKEGVPIGARSAGQAQTLVLRLCLLISGPSKESF